ncbi:hypothetical protein SK128_020860 [Halocaridina rubra]|uniref:Uncharacterized protein n=1 Tax=Halocaridina rubra TaxID=373956 RepID=A0AAN9A275_HALRR
MSTADETEAGRSEKRRNSASSHTSKASSTSERVTDRVASFLQTARKIRRESRSHSLIGSDDEVCDQRYAASSESISDIVGDADVPSGDFPVDNSTTSGEESSVTVHTPLLVKAQKEARLSPIASGASLSTLVSQNISESGFEFRRARGSVRGSSGALFAEDNGSGAAGNTTPVLSGSGTGGSFPLSTQSYLTLRCITNQHRRFMSESSQEDKTSRNSLKGFLSSNYEQGVP